MKMIKSSKFNKNFYVLINTNKVDTLYMDYWNFDWGRYFKENPLPNLKDVIISKSLIKGYKSIYIEDLNAENIYIEGEENLGGLTFNSDIILKNKQSITIDNHELKESFIKEINILCKEDIAKIELDKSFYNIHIEKYKNNVLIKTKSQNIERWFIVDELGKITIENKKCIITENDIINKILDLREFIDYKEIYFYNKINVDTLIVDNNVIKNIDKFKHINYADLGSGKRLSFKKIVVHENNDMKLFLKENTFEVKNFLFGAGKNKYIYLKTNEDNEIVIFVDETDNIKIINKEEIYKDLSVIYVKFKFKYNISDFFSRYNNISNLILVQYSNDNYKFIELDKTYEIDDKFIRFLNLNADKYFSTSLGMREFLEDKNLFHLFKENTIANITGNYVAENIITNIGDTFIFKFYEKDNSNPPHTYQYSMPVQKAIIVDNTFNNNTYIPPNSADGKFVDILMSNFANTNNLDVHGNEYVHNALNVTTWDIIGIRKWGT